MPIAYYGRTYAEGKNITWRDGFKAVFVLFAGPAAAAVSRDAAPRGRCCSSPASS